MIKILEDCGQKEGQHKAKNDYWSYLGIDVLRYPLPVGDYVLMTDDVADVIRRDKSHAIRKMDFCGSYARAVDTKKDLQEICGNICGKSHTRFRSEVVLAKQMGVALLVLVENTDGVTDLESLAKWENPRSRYSPKATSGATLAKAMATMQDKYGVKFAFCTPEDAGASVLKWLLGVSAYINPSFFKGATEGSSDMLNKIQSESEHIKAKSLIRTSIWPEGTEFEAHKTSNGWITIYNGVYAHVYERFLRDNKLCEIVSQR